MSMPTKKKRPKDCDAARSEHEEIAKGELVVGVAAPNPPISVRMSAALLERLDRLASAQHRSRGNLIQHVLWEYVMKNKP